MSKTISTKSVAVLSDAMLAQQAATRQTIWINFCNTALRFRALYVSGAERGSIFGLVRTLDGKAFLIVKSKTTPTLDSRFVAGDAVTMRSRRLDAYIVAESTNENDGALVGLLIDENKTCYRVVRATAYDNDGYDYMTGDAIITVETVETVEKK